MRDAGGKRLMTEEIQIKYGFDEGELDLIAGNLFPTRYGTSAEVEGREAEVASTAHRSSRQRFGHADAGHQREISSTSRSQSAKIPKGAEPE